MSSLMAFRQTTAVARSTVLFCSVKNNEKHVGRNIHQSKPAVRVSPSPKVYYVPKIFTRVMCGQAPSDEDLVKCWKCRKDFIKESKTVHTCPDCLKAPKDIDYFQLFELDRSFDIDLKYLANKFKALQRIFHPDVAAQKSAEEKATSEMWSSLINGGYVTLQKPHLRANYLLKLYGESIEEEQMMLDPEFLAEVMELNEEISEADTPGKVAALVKQVREVLNGYEAKVMVAFQDNDIKKAKHITCEMQYFVNLKLKLIEKESELGISH